MDGGIGAMDLENCHFGDSPGEPCGAATCLMGLCRFSMRVRSLLNVIIAINIGWMGF